MDRISSLVTRLTGSVTTDNIRSVGDDIRTTSGTRRALACGTGALLLLGFAVIVATGTLESWIDANVGSRNVTA